MDILDILNSQKAERDLLSSKEYALREKLSFGNQWLNSGLVKIIVGPRRAGKSIFCFLLLKGKNYAYVNFDDNRLLGLSNLDGIENSLKQVYGDVSYYFFDEIQNFPDWELFVERLRRNGKNLIITGSNSKLLNGKAASFLTGRYVEINIFPFSFEEILNYQKSLTKESQETLQISLDKYLEQGGYPEVVIQNYDSQTYLQSLFDATVSKDVISRHTIRDPKKIEVIANYAASNSGKDFTYRQIANLDSIHQSTKSYKTVHKYLEYLEEAYLIFVLERFNLSQKTQVSIRAPRKLYVLDPGLAKVMQHTLSDDLGVKLETAVFDALLNQYYFGNHLYYYKTRNNKEVDFIIVEDNKVSKLIQVAFALEDKKTLDRETNALLEASGELHCDDLIIITYRDSKIIEKDGKTIKVTSFTDWSHGSKQKV